MRQFLANDFKCETWDEVAFYLQQLVEKPIQTKDEFAKWLKDKNEFDAVLEENMAWRYIKMTIDTHDEEASKSYQFFNNEIQPKLAPFEDQLNRKLIESPFIADFESDDAYRIYFRSVRTSLELFREENIPLETEVNNLSQEYGGIVGQQTIQYLGEEMTMPKAANYLKNQDESIRKEVYTLIVQRRALDTEKLNELFNKLVSLRNQIAVNAGCSDYREYMFKALGRFDYSVQDCLDFHSSIEKFIVPITKELQVKHASKLGKLKLKPWDSEVDPDGKEPLIPFKNGDELLEKTIAIFDELDPYFGDCLKTMKVGNYLDLDSKTGKAPGGYNYPLYESGIPFIFMNAASAQRDLVTMVHEGGHAVHSFISNDLELTAFKNLPSEVAELASMSMELITMEGWRKFYDSEDEFIRAKREQLESIIKVLPWIAIVDAFQHWIYTNPSHSEKERTEEWLNINARFGTGMTDFEGFEFVKENAWHKQLHIFEVPFYYIEYGIAQLGALGVWQNFVENPKTAIEKYKAALSLGYSKSIPEIYEAAGLNFDFTPKKLSELSIFLEKELSKLS